MVESQQRTAGKHGFGRHRLLLVVLLWALVAGAIQYYAWREMLTPPDVVARLVGVCQRSSVGPLLFMGAAALSPLLLIPAALLGGIAGGCFGPTLGVVYTLIGCNLSALLTYSLGRMSRRADGPVAALCARYGSWLERHPFLGVIVLRLSFLPYDLVNYLVGLLRLRLGLFLLANTIGSLPGVLLIVFAGNAVHGFANGLPALPAGVIVGLIGLLLLSVIGALLLRRRVSQVGEGRHDG